MGVQKWSWSVKGLAVPRQQRGSILAAVLQALRQGGSKGHWSWQQDSEQQSIGVVGSDADSQHHASGGPLWPAIDQLSPIGRGHQTSNTELGCNTACAMQCWPAVECVVLPPHTWWLVGMAGQECGGPACAPASPEPTQEEYQNAVAEATQGISLSVELINESLQELRDAADDLDV